MKRFIRRAVIAMLLGVVVYGAFVLYAGFHRITGSLATFHWWTFAVAIALATLNYAIRYVKWEYYLARLKIKHVSKLDSLLVFLSGFVLTITPGKVGEVFKSAVLAETHHVPMRRTAPIVVADRLTDVIGVIILIVAGSAGFAGGLPWAIAGSTAVAIGMVFIIWQRPALALIRIIEHGPHRLRPLAPKLRESFEALRILAGPSALFWPICLAILGWASEGVALYALLAGFGRPPSVTLCIFFYATATLAGAVIPVPGGLGVTETMLQEQIVHLGHIAAGAATSAMILVRFATLWWAVLIGFGALAALRVRYPSLLRDEREPVAPGVVRPKDVEPL